MKAASQKTLPPGIDAAFDEQLNRLKELKARGLQLLGVFLMAMVVIIDNVTEANIPLTALAIGVTVVVWFGIVGALIRRRRLPAWLSWATFVFENLFPWIVLFQILGHLGAHGAMKTWGPVLLFSGIQGLSILELRPLRSLLGGVIGAVAVVVVATIAGGTLEAREAAGWAGPHLAVRAGGLLLSGLLSSFIAIGLRQAFGRSVRVARARDLFGKYVVGTEIARGGMGVVHRARYCPEGGFERDVALKLVHGHLAKDPKFVDAFRREAALQARLVHPNIVQVFDVGSVDGAWFFAMELVDGLDLATLLRTVAERQTTLPLPILTFIARELLRGLVHAHDEAVDADGRPLRIIHRDLAPQNVLVSKAGQVKIGDFGVARALGDHESTVTRAAGHRGHIAPEHADGRPIDQRSDLFCLGVLLWELCTTRRLFARDSDVATLAALMIEPAPPPSSVHPSMAPLDLFLARALEKDPDARFNSASDMLAALDDLVVATDVGVADAAALGALVRDLLRSDDDVTELTPLSFDPTEVLPARDPASTR